MLATHVLKPNFSVSIVVGKHGGPCGLKRQLRNLLRFPVMTGIVQQ